MNEQVLPIALVAAEMSPRVKRSNYPEPFASQMVGREKRAIGDLFGIVSFGVNLTKLSPGACSALRHAHSKQDEFIYILQGYPILVTNAGETHLEPGMCAGFKAGTGNGHHLLNRSDAEVLYLEVGDRAAGDSVIYPDDDLKAVFTGGQWQFTHKDGLPY